MIKIPLQFIQQQLRISVIISSPHYRVRLKPVTFIVDTGSPRSFLSEGEALKLGLPTNALTHDSQIRMGGSIYNLYKTKSFNFIFKTENQQTVSMNSASFFVAKTTRKTEDAKRESENFPCIVGTDFFIEHLLCLFFDPSNNEYYIGRKDAT